MNKKNLISLVEYEISDENYKLNESELKEIRKLNKQYFPNSKDGESGILDLVSKDRIKAKQYVGVIQIGKRTIQVLPKVIEFKSEKEEVESNIIKNLLYMLHYTKRLKLKETDISSLSKNSNLYEVIIYLFAKNLIELLKIDLVKNYETKEDNNNFLKGKILFSKHLRFNLFNKAKFYSQFDEFTEDNLLNQVFKATTDKLLKYTQDSKNFKLLSECNLILQDVSLNKINFVDTEKVKFNRLNAEYENIFNLAKLLLFGNSIDLNAKDTKSYSLMFDMNKLFEEFIFEFIKKECCNPQNYLIRTENPQKHLFKETPRFDLKPDITIYSDDGKECKLIIDTKYKKINEFKSEEENGDKYKMNGISTQDIYQMFVYSQIYNCENIILLYPKYQDSIFDKQLKFDNEEKINLQNFQIKIKTVDLHIDLSLKKQYLIKELNTILGYKYNPETNKCEIIKQ